MVDRLNLRVRVALFFVALAVGTNVAVAAGLFLAFRRLNQPELLPAFQQVGLVAGAVILVLVFWVWFLFDLNVARPIIRLAGKLRARAHAAVDGAFDEPTARYLGDLAPAAQATALTLAETRNALAESVARETSRLSSEKARLEALLSDVPVGVLLCSGEHQLVFYNGPAVDLLNTAGAPGLDRNLFDYLRDGPIRHAHQRLTDAGDPDAASDILCTTVVGARMLAARMRLIGGSPGYVLTLRDVTAALASYTRREALLSELFDRVRRPAANLLALLELLPDDVPKAVSQALGQEVTGLVETVTDLGRRHDETRHDGWPLAVTRASDLLDGLRARLERAGLEAEVGDAPLLLRCNGFEVIGLVATLAARVAADHAGDRFRVTLAEEGAEAMLRLLWHGRPLTIARLDDWLAEPIEPGVPEVTGETVLRTHMTEIWPEPAGEGTQALCLPLRVSRRTGRRAPAIPRAVVYDFDLLSKARNDRVAEARLEDLTYVVFDTETTGLMPSQDEIVQIAAVRIVNGRRVEAEVFDTLVNPHRPIPPASTEVHGITDAMVAEAPDIVAVGRSFHKFAEGAVLVAHNAPFDMEFLRRAEPFIGRRFDNPVLDTVLLSAALFGPLEGHSLDALTHRLGITIPDEARHTAIGDTVATAEAFLKLLPMLQARGYATFGDVLAEIRRHSRQLKELNEAALT